MSYRTQILLFQIQFHIDKEISGNLSQKVLMSCAENKVQRILLFYPKGIKQRCNLAMKT